MLFTAGSDDDELLIVRRGVIKITVPIHKKNSYHLINVGPGEFAGGIGFLEGSGHATDALALTDVEVYVLPHKQFRMLAHQHPELALAIMHQVALNFATRLRVTISEVQALRG
jgi:SulP family sulfate permease